MIATSGSRDVCVAGGRTGTTYTSHEDDMSGGAQAMDARHSIWMMEEKSNCKTRGMMGTYEGQWAFLQSRQCWASPLCPLHCTKPVHSRPEDRNEQEVFSKQHIEIQTKQFPRNTCPETVISIGSELLWSSCLRAK